MEFVGYVQDYQLRDLLRIGQTATILKHSDIRVTKVDAKPGDRLPVGYVSIGEQQVKVANFLPGHVDVYADKSTGKQAVHNHRVVWIREDGMYCDTDINNVKEIRDAK